MNWAKEFVSLWHRCSLFFCFTLCESLCVFCNSRRFIKIILFTLRSIKYEPNPEPEQIDNRDVPRPHTLYPLTWLSIHDFAVRSVGFIIQTVSLPLFARPTLSAFFFSVCIIFSMQFICSWNRLLYGTTLLNGKNFIQLNLIAFSYQSYFLFSLLPATRKSSEYLCICHKSLSALSRLTSWCHKYKGILTSSAFRFFFHP